MISEQSLQLFTTVLPVCLAVVFLLLIILIVMIKKQGDTIQELRSGRPEEKGTLPAAAVLPGAAVEQGIPEEVVAVIAAAVYAACGASGGAITGIRRAPAQSAFPAWRMAGLLENTRPF